MLSTMGRCAESIFDQGHIKVKVIFQGRTHYVVSALYLLKIFMFKVIVQG